MGERKALLISLLMLLALGQHVVQHFCLDDARIDAKGARAIGPFFHTEDSRKHVQGGFRAREVDRIQTTR